MNKFDVVFTNPPYDGNSTDLKLIKTLIENKISDKIVAVHPTTFLWSKKRVSDIMINALKEVNVFWGNEMFNIKLFVPVGITIWDINNTKDTITVNDNAYSMNKYESEFDKINIHGDVKYFKFKENIEQYMKNHNGSILDHHITGGYTGMTKFSVRFSSIKGNICKDNKVKDDFWSLINKNRKENECDETFRYSSTTDKYAYNRMTLWSFKNEKERQNFITYCETKIVRFLLTLIKFNANLQTGETSIIPWLDFSKEWTDEKLIKEFDINKELWDYIDKFIPDYYEDYRKICRGDI